MSLGRVKGFTKEKMTLFFDLLRPKLEVVKSDSSKMFTVDETGINSVKHKHNTVAA
jgi:hypothetical protein